MDYSYLIDERNKSLFDELTNQYKITIKFSEDNPNPIGTQNMILLCTRRLI